MGPQRRVEPDSLESSAYISIQLFEPRTLKFQPVDPATTKFDRIEADSIDVDLEEPSEPTELQIEDVVERISGRFSAVEVRDAAPDEVPVEVVLVDPTEPVVRPLHADVVQVEPVEEGGTVPFTRPYALLEIDAPPPELSASRNLVERTVPTEKVPIDDELSLRTIAIVAFIAMVSALGIGLGASLLLFGA